MIRLVQIRPLNSLLNQMILILAKFAKCFEKKIKLSKEMRSHDNLTVQPI